ncbi:AzlD domain-containing protein [Zoogloea sp.]|uniref:AzlD domain-containing protein n=1 Tax=Zoogloea sp. TaxID=49181 RepID=UPI0035AE6727
MSEDGMLWLTFVLIGALATTLPRASFIVLGERASLPETLLKALRYAPAAALAAIVVPDVVLVAGTVEVFNPKLGAAIAAVLASRLSKNPWLPFVAGMAVLWLLR